MNYHVVITTLARIDVEQNHEWWSTHRSLEEANRWYVGIYDAMSSLTKMPERHAHADESALAARGIRQMAFGLSARPTHRILYGVKGDSVIVYRVRAASQDSLESHEITPDA